jgi:hypothetical protein
MMPTRNVRIPVVTLCFILSLVLLRTDPVVAGGDELKVRVGDTEKTVLELMGAPLKKVREKGSGEKLLYRGMIIRLKNNRVSSIAAGRGFKGTILSVAVGDSVLKARGMLGRPDKTQGKRLVYYDVKGCYVRLAADCDNRYVQDIYVSKAISHDAVGKRDALRRDLVARGIRPSEEEIRDRRVSLFRHKEVTKDEYRKARREGLRRSRKAETLNARIMDKHPPFTPIEKQHDLHEDMVKFRVNYAAVEEGRRKSFTHDCFFSRFDAGLRKKLDALSKGDRVTVLGHWEDHTVRSRNDFAGMEMKRRAFITIFMVDKLK